MSLITLLARDTGLSIRDIGRIVLTAPKRYKVFTIPKRNGGERVIAQPAYEVKALQSLVVMRVLAGYPVHESAYAYVRGRNIRQNALRHAKSNHILKLDFCDFFHTIRPVDLERVLRSRDIEGITAADYEAIYQLIFWGRGTTQPECLSIGAPSSPIVSNIVMYDFDRSASEIASELRLTYTRYADDLTISSDAGVAPLLRFERRLARLVSRSPLSIALNDGKRGLYGKGERRMVTGLVITPNGSVSIGRERKRLIRSIVHHVVTGRADDRLLMRSKGMLAFVISAEPAYLKTLMRTFGRDAIRSILRSPQISFYQDEAVIDLN